MDPLDMTSAAADTCSVTASIVVLALSAAALRSAIRVIFAVGEASKARARCLQWAVVATITALVADVTRPGDCVEPAPLIAIAVAAFDCWLALLSGSGPTLPDAIARTCRPKGRRAS